MSGKDLVDVPSLPKAFLKENEHPGRPAAGQKQETRDCRWEVGGYGGESQITCGPGFGSLAQGERVTPQGRREQLTAKLSGLLS